MQAAHCYHRQVIPGESGVDALLDHQLIGSFPDLAQARAELDRVAYESALRATAADRLTPFGVVGGPAPAIAVTDSALDDAYRDFCAFFASSPKVLERAVRALDIAKNHDRFTVRADGSATIQGSRRYTVTDEGCTCRDFFIRQSTHAGMCKHTIARELYRLAQAKHVHDAPPVEALPTADIDSMAFAEVASLAFARALLNVSADFAFGSATTAQLSIVGSAVVFEVEGRRERVEGREGSGDAAGRHTLILSADQFHQLWDAFRPVARTIESVQVFLDRAAATVFVCQADFGVEIHGTPMT